MKKVNVTTIVVSVLVALGLLLGLMPLSQQIAYAETVRGFDFFNRSYKATALDLHIEFNTTVSEVVDPNGQVPFRDPNGNLQVSGLGSNKLYFWGNPGVRARDSVTITFRFDGSPANVRRAWFTYTGSPEPQWSSNMNVQQAESLLSQALKATKSEKLRERLQALGPKPLSNFDTLMGKDGPTQINDLNKLAGETGDPVAALLAKVAALVEQVIVKADVSDVATISPERGKSPGPVTVQPGPAPAATPSRGGTAAEQAQATTPPPVYVLAQDPQSGKPYLMPIEDVFVLKGKGTVVTGRVERGLILSPSTISVPVTQEAPGEVTKMLDEGRRGQFLWTGGADRKTVVRIRVRNDPASSRPILVNVFDPSNGTLIEQTWLRPGEGMYADGAVIEVALPDDPMLKGNNQANVHYEIVPVYNAPIY